MCNFYSFITLKQFRAIKFYKVILLLQLLTSCSTDQKKQNEKVSQEENTNETYQLVWNNEFDDIGKPDKAKWNYEYGFVRNEEMRYYTDSPKNARLENGHLILEGYKEKIANANFVSTEAENWKENREFTDYSSASLTT